MEFISEGGVYKVDKEFIREEGDCLIVCVRRGNVIWSARQGVWSAEILAWDVFKGTVTPKTVPMFGSFVLHMKWCVEVWESRLALVWACEVVTPGYLLT